MDAHAQRPSAQILAFPAGGRRSASFLSAKAQFAAEVRALRNLKIAPETAWYHQDAIEKPSSKNKN